MQFGVKSVPVGRHRTPCVVVGVFESRRLSPSAAALDRLTRGYIVNILRRGDMKAAPGRTLFLFDAPRTVCERILLVGCGKEAEVGDARYRKILAGMAAALRDSGVKEALCCLPEIEVTGRDLAWKLRQTAVVVGDALYRFDRLKSRQENGAAPLARLHLNLPSDAPAAAARRALRSGEAIARGVSFAKDLGNLPPNICTPSYLADQARKLCGGNARLSAKILTEKEIEALKMGALLSVTRGSRQPPRLIVISYNGGPRGEKPYVLVGKGITFDSGGISIKPSDRMDEMKFDMCGAASVFGTLAAVADLGLPLNVVGVVPSCENLPDGNASKPGDIVTSLSGQTIEILNTDAEGRLILCDALTYCERFEPRRVIDIATLTGACVVALGKHASGLFGNDENLIEELRQAGLASGDRAWELPLWEEYGEQLRSNFADMANVGGREGGAITAASFLSRFTRKYAWAHLDIAGVAWRSGAEKGATGRPVPLLVQYLLDRAEAAA
jgi:leucyl aminopeptidase